MDLCQNEAVMEKDELWQNLPLNLRHKLKDSSRTLEKRRGDTVYLQGDPPQGIYFVEKGLVGLMLVGATSGKEHLLRFFRQGQFFGHRSLFANEGYHGTTKVLEPTVLRLVPKAAVLGALNEHPDLYRDIVKVLSKELRRCEEQHVMILENQILSRTAQALVYLKDLHPEHMWTRQEIANFCASTVSTIIKALGELEERGYIQQDGRSIEILDRDALIHLQDHDSY